MRELQGNHIQNAPGERCGRRSFIRTMGGGALAAGLGAFMQSCAEQEVRLTADLAVAYVESLLHIVETIREKELVTIQKAAMYAVQARLQGNELFAFMRHGMIPYETARLRPGSPHIFTTDSSATPSRNDFLVTNDPGAARGLSEQYVKVVGITTPAVPNMLTPQTEFEVPGTFRIEDVAQLVIFCHIPHTDAILDVEGVEVPICPVSGVIESLVYYALTAEIVEGFTRSAIYPDIGV